MMPNAVKNEYKPWRFDVVVFIASDSYVPSSFWRIYVKEIIVILFNIITTGIGIS